MSTTNQPEQRSDLDTAAAAVSALIIALGASLAVAASIGASVLVQRSQRFEPDSDELVGLQLHALEIMLMGLTGAGLLLAAGIGLLILRSNRRGRAPLVSTSDPTGRHASENLR